ncbi:MAG: hypothetical protein HY580_01530 [Nitrospinae bacterium]|nr:hypothetical protein [Nitrospinota bacterium]
MDDSARVDRHYRFRASRSLAAAVKSIAFLCVWLWSLSNPAPAAASDYRYHLFKNTENFGILVFPAESLFPDLESYILSQGFASAETGDAVMRFGTKRENQTFMMPESVQKKHRIEKFIILQVLSDKSLMVGVYDTEWGLTLPQAIYQLDDVKKNVPQTLDIFRGKKPAEKKEGPGQTIDWNLN